MFDGAIFFYKYIVRIYICTIAYDLLHVYNKLTSYFLGTIWGWDPRFVACEGRVILLHAPDGDPFATLDWTCRNSRERPQIGVTPGLGPDWAVEVGLDRTKTVLTRP